MAKFTFTGLDSIQYQLQARGAKVSGTVNQWNVEEVETEE